MSDFSQSDAAVRQVIDDVTGSKSLYKTLHDFSQRLTTLHNDLVKAEGEYLLLPGQADQMTAEYCESFIWSVIQTIEKSRQTDATDKRKLTDDRANILLHSELAHPTNLTDTVGTDA